MCACPLELQDGDISEEGNRSVKFLIHKKIDACKSAGGTGNVCLPVHPSVRPRSEMTDMSDNESQRRKKRRRAPCVCQEEPKGVQPVLFQCHQGRGEGGLDGWGGGGLQGRGAGEGTGVRAGNVEM